jgi:uncharacterized protein (TIGR03083 family)
MIVRAILGVRMISPRYGNDEDMADLWTRIRDERAALAELLAGLTDEQWQQMSLCEEWSVRDVVAHVIGSYERETLPFLFGLVRNGCSIDAYNQRTLERIGRVSNHTLLARYNATVNLRSKPPIPTQFVLAETLVHNEDIFRALEHRRVVPIETSLIVAQLYRSIGMARKWRRTHGYIRLEANDADWTYGEGDIASGSLLSLVMLLAGRDPSALDLDGDGARRLIRSSAEIT